MHVHKQQTLRITTTTRRVSCLQLMLHHTLLPYCHHITNKACQHADFATSSPICLHIFAMCLHLSFDVAHALQTPACHLLTHCTFNQLLQAAKRIGMDSPPCLQHERYQLPDQSMLDALIRPYLVCTLYQLSYVIEFARTSFIQKF